MPAGFVSILPTDEQLIAAATLRFDDTRGDSLKIVAMT
jgi:hypothetical protein